MNFFSTLAIFPVYLFDIKKNNNQFIISDKFYQDVVIFLTFNTFCTLGNILARYKRFVIIISIFININNTH